MRLPETLGHREKRSGWIKAYPGDWGIPELPLREVAALLFGAGCGRANRKLLRARGPGLEKLHQYR